MTATTKREPLNLRVEDLTDVATRIEAASRALCLFADQLVAASPDDRRLQALQWMCGAAEGDAQALLTQIDLLKEELPAGARS